MTQTLDEAKILEEVVVLLRNSNVLSTTERNVTTTTDTGNIAAGTVTNLPLANTAVKNVRSVTVNSVLLTRYTDYTINYDYTANACLITFTTPRTVGHSYSIQYDYGTDAIFPDYARSDLSIDSFPRMGVDFVDIPSEIGGMGNVNLNRYDLSIAIYAKKKGDIRIYTKAVRTVIIDNQNLMHYLRTIKPTMTGPILPGSFERFKDKVFQRNFDFCSLMNLEVN